LLRNQKYNTILMLKTHHVAVREVMNTFQLIIPRNLGFLLCNQII